jgi:hypothetical protein
LWLIVHKQRFKIDQDWLSFKSGNGEKRPDSRPQKAAESIQKVPAKMPANTVLEGLN